MSGPTIDYYWLSTFCQRLANFPGALAISPHYYGYSETLDNLLSNQVRSILFQDDKLWEQTTKHSRAYYEIVQKISRSDADFDFNEFRKRSDQIDSELSGDLSIYTKQWGLSVVALYYYKNEEFEKADSYLRECINLNDYLIRKGIYYLHYRILGLNCNLARIYCKSGSVELGMTQFRDLVVYLLTGKSGRLTGCFLNNKYYFKLAPSYREGYLYECFEEFVVRFSSESLNTPIVCTIDFNFLFGYLNKLKNTTPERCSILNWYHAKRNFLDSNYKIFGKQSTHFFSQPIPAQFAILKVSLLQDIALLIFSLQFPDQADLISKIGCYLEKNFGQFSSINAKITDDKINRINIIQKSR
jgi:hypothetical protein